MNGIILKSGVICIALNFLFAVTGNAAVVDTLNPEGANPHAAAPRKRITPEQKKAAAEARKQKKAEIAARKEAAAASNVSSAGGSNSK